MRRLLHIIWREIVYIMPAIIFFAITFNLIMFTETLMLQHNMPSNLSYGLATLAALLVGKFIIIVNTFPYINAFPNKPMIYNIVWKLLIYGILLILFRIAEKALDLFFKYHNITVICDKIDMIVATPMFWAIQIWLIMSFTVYIVASEFTRVIGRDKMMTLLVGHCRGTSNQLPNT
jgi:hypothetical protein